MSNLAMENSFNYLYYILQTIMKGFTQLLWFKWYIRQILRRQKKGRNVINVGGDGWKFSFSGRLWSWTGDWVHWEALILRNLNQKKKRGTFLAINETEKKGYVRKGKCVNVQKLSLLPNFRQIRRGHRVNYISFK